MVRVGPHFPYVYSSVWYKACRYSADVWERKGRREDFGLRDSVIIILFEVNLLLGNAPCDNEMLSDLTVPSTL